MKKKLYLLTLKKSVLAGILLISAGLMLASVSFKAAASHNAKTHADPGLSNIGEAISMDSSGDGGKLAIVIDDFGSGRGGVKEMLAINRHLTFSVIPFQDFSVKDAVDAHEKGFEVIAHLPLEPNYGKMSWLGPHPILSGMKSDEVKEITRKSVDGVPYAAGANIHMGSRASGEEGVMTAILEVIKEKDLYFVDSRTASHPIGKKISDLMGVPCFERDVFLDGQQPGSFVKKRLAEAGEAALKKGQAVAIGHVGVEGGVVTADAISEMLPEFDRKNIRLVFVSELDR